MKKLKKITGILMIIAVMGGLFALTCEDGVLNALKLWGFAIGLTAVIVGGVLLVTSD